MHLPTIANDWEILLSDERKQPYFQQLMQFLQTEYERQTIFPTIDNVFNALKYTAFHEVKVVILGQDPYHGQDQANGLAFSVHKGIKQPPSLVNIFKELETDLGYPRPSHGDLTAWARQGVLLLNTVLTVRKAEANSHRNQGWETFTNKIITTLNDKTDPVIYILWGAAAQKKQALIDTEKHYIIKAPHPSPLSAYRGFFGSKPFSQVNTILAENGMKEIDWKIE